MKTIIITSIIFLLTGLYSTPVNAQGMGRQHADLVIQVPDRGLYKVVVRNQTFESGGKDIILPALRAGVYPIQIFKMRNHGPFRPPTWDYLGGADIELRGRSTVLATWHDRRGLRTKVEPGLRFSQNYRPNQNNRPIRRGNVSFAPVYEMNPQVFNSLRAQLAASSFESTRLEVAKVAISNNGISTAQLHTVLGFFSFESSRLELAQFAYPHTFDQNNYFMISDVFTFDSSKRSLLAFISR